MQYATNRYVTMYFYLHLVAHLLGTVEVTCNRNQSPDR